MKSLLLEIIIYNFKLRVTFSILHSPTKGTRRQITNTTNQGDKDHDHGDDADGSDALSSPQANGVLRIHEP